MIAPVGECLAVGVHELSGQAQQVDEVCTGLFAIRPARNMVEYVHGRQRICHQRIDGPVRDAFGQRIQLVKQGILDTALLHQLAQTLLQTQRPQLCDGKIKRRVPIGGIGQVGQCVPSELHRPGIQPPVLGTVHLQARPAHDGRVGR